MTPIHTQVTFRGLPHSDHLESQVRERVAWLAQFYAGVTRCRVIVTLPHQHQQGGRHFLVRIELTVPGGPPIVINNEPSSHQRLKDIEQEAHHKDAEIESVHRYARLAVSSNGGESCTVAGTHDEVMVVPSKPTDNWRALAATGRLSGGIDSA